MSSIRELKPPWFYRLIFFFRFYRLDRKVCDYMTHLVDGVGDGVDTLGEHTVGSRVQPGRELTQHVNTVTEKEGKT